MNEYRPSACVMTDDVISEAERFSMQHEWSDKQQYYIFSHFSSQLISVLVPSKCDSQGRSNKYSSKPVPLEFPGNGEVIAVAMVCTPRLMDSLKHRNEVFAT